MTHHSMLIDPAVDARGLQALEARCVFLPPSIAHTWFEDLESVPHLVVTCLVVPFVCDQQLEVRPVALPVGERERLPGPYQL